MWGFFGRVNRPKLCGKCLSTPRNFDTRKLGEITVFDTVPVIYKPVYDGSITRKWVNISACYK